MQITNRKEIIIKTLLILISMLSIILIKEGIDNIGHAIDVIENQGGFDIYPINHPDTIVQGWYYCIFVEIIFTLCPIIILILSIISMFIKNRMVEISIIVQTFFILLLTMTANNNYQEIRNKIGDYPLLIISVLICLTIIIISMIKKKSLFVFYILGVVLLIIKYINVFKLWCESARWDNISLLSWFDTYCIKYAIITILGFSILILKLHTVNQPIPRKTPVVQDGYQPDYSD